MDPEEYKIRFDRLYSNLLGTCDTFYSWKSLQYEQYQPIFDAGKYFWGAVLISLQNEWLLSLAKCFEDSSFSKSDQVISVFGLLKYHTDVARKTQAENLLHKHDKVLKAIARLRDHQLAHLNAAHLQQPHVLLGKFPIVFGEVEDLMNEFPTLFSLLNPEAGIGYILDNYTKEPEREGKYAMKQIQFFNKKREEHMQKYVSGEVESPFLPEEKI